MRFKGGEHHFETLGGAGGIVLVLREGAETVHGHRDGPLVAQHPGEGKAFLNAASARANREVRSWPGDASWRPNRSWLEPIARSAATTPGRSPTAW